MSDPCFVLQFTEPHYRQDFGTYPLASGYSKHWTTHTLVNRRCDEYSVRCLGFEARPTENTERSAKHIVKLIAPRLEVSASAADTQQFSVTSSWRDREVSEVSPVQPQHQAKALNTRAQHLHEPRITLRIRPRNRDLFRHGLHNHMLHRDISRVSFLGHASTTCTTVLVGAWLRHV